MMNIYYRGYVIHEDIRSILYTVYGPRPQRAELAVSGTAGEAMQWVDEQIRRETPETFVIYPGALPDSVEQAF